MAIQSSKDVLSTVNFLRDLGLMPLPIKRDSKITYLEDFTNPDFVTPYDHWEKQDLGVGVVLSEKYRLVDIDLDEQGISKLAENHLPKNGWIFGRNGKPRSHFMFLVSGDAQKSHISRDKDPKGKAFMDTEKVNHVSKDPKERKTILEYRADGSQTVMPGTIHEKTGELIQWSSGHQPKGLPAEVDPEELRRAVRKIGFTVTFAKHAWHDGMRHDVTLCLSSMMASANWEIEEALHWFRCLMDYTGQGERRNVESCVRDTYKAIGNKQRIAGAPRLAEITGNPDVVSQFRHLFSDARQALFEDMNAKYAMAVYFSKLCILDMAVVDDLNNPDFETMTPQDFGTLLSNKKVRLPASGKRKEATFIPASRFWIEHPDRQTFRQAVFAPGQPKILPNDQLNLWRGWGAERDHSGSADRWLWHVENIICGGDADMFSWVMDWMADIVQDPMNKPGTAILMRSGTGTGKNTFVEMLKRVIGVRYLRELNSKAQITGRFNDHLQYALMVFANEADFASSSAAENVLKTLITDRDYFMEKKHGAGKMSRSCSRVVLASNKLHVVQKDRDDRRYTVVDVVNPSEIMSDAEKKEHFDAVYEEIGGDGPGKLLDILMSREYDKDVLRVCKSSRAGQIQVLMSMNPVAQWWTECLMRGEIYIPEREERSVVYADGALGGWPDKIGKSALYASFSEFNRSSSEKVSASSFHHHLYECSGIDGATNTVQVGGRSEKRYRALQLPDLNTCVSMMSEKYPGAVHDLSPDVMEEVKDSNVERPDDMEEY